MPKRIELPAQIGGDPEAQLRQLYSYLYQMAEALNSNLAEIGGNALTDDEMVIMREVIGDGNPDVPGMSEGETLKSMIIKTAQFVRSQIDEYNLTLIGTYEAEGKLGKYVRKTRLDVDVTPTGIQQNYTFQDIIQGLKTYEVNAKNYIKTGLLRTVSSVPVYGVAIGKDVVTFSEDGTETYNDGNKVAELTADELSFWQNSVKVASYTGNKISFYNGGSEVMYIQNGKIYCTNDLELASGKKLIITTDNLSIDASGNVVLKGDVEILSGKSMAVKTGGALNIESGGEIDIHATGELELTGSTVSIKSGSTFDVEATNFEISSQDKKMVSGKWEFNDGGIRFDDGYNNPPFMITNSPYRNDNEYGIWYDESIRDGIGLYTSKTSGNNRYIALIKFFMKINSDNSSVLGITPDADIARLGESGYHFDEAYFDDCYAYRILTGSNQIIPIVVGGAAMYIKVSGGTVLLYGSTSYSESDTTEHENALTLLGMLKGGRTPISTISSGSLDDYKQTGIWEVNIAYVTGKPSDLPQYPNPAYWRLEVFNWSEKVQVLSCHTCFYSRRYGISSWDSWYKFTGTAV